jgi:hypothetical protein
MEDFRNENLALRNRLKSNVYSQNAQMRVPSPTKHMYHSDEFPSILLGQRSSISNASTIGDIVASNDIMKTNHSNYDDDYYTSGILYTPDCDVDDSLINKNEILQQRLNELEKLQMQLNA